MRGIEACLFVESLELGAGRRWGGGGGRGGGSGGVLLVLCQSRAGGCSADPHSGAGALRLRGKTDGRKKGRRRGCAPLPGTAAAAALAAGAAALEAADAGRAAEAFDAGAAEAAPAGREKRTGVGRGHRASRTVAPSPPNYLRLTQSGSVAAVELGRTLLRLQWRWREAGRAGPAHASL